MKRIGIIGLFSLAASGFMLHDADDVIATLKQRIAQQHRNMARVKLDLFFHQPKYSPGDTALVRTQYLGAADLKLVGGRELIYVLLYDQNGKVVLNAHFVANNGWSSNKLAIPEKILPGIYLLVAYTSWMRNEDPSLFFRQDLIIAGPRILEKVDESAPTLEIYPEGGTMIAGINNNVTIRRRGNTQPNQVIVRSGDEEIVKSNFDRDGLASIHFTPEPGKVYKAELVGAEKLTMVDLPAAANEGFAVQVSGGNNDALSVRIGMVLSEEASRRSYFLVIIGPGGLIYSNRIVPSRNHQLDLVLPVGFQDGVAELIITDTNLKAWCTRPIYFSGSSQFDITIPAIKATYATREDASLAVEVKDRSGRAVQGYFSANITNQTFFDDGTLTRPDNLLLYSDISATFKLKDPDNDVMIQQYLNTQTCPWLKWSELESGKIKASTIPPKSHLVLSGKVVMTETGMPVPDSTNVMFFFQKQMVGYERLITKNGQFNFPVLFDFVGEDDALYTASRKGRDVNGISIKLDSTDSVYAFRADPWRATNEEDRLEKFNLQRRSIDKSFLFFTKLKFATDSSADLNHFIEKELGGPDIVFNTRDYILFPTMEELIREVLKAVDYRKIRGRDVVRVYTTNKLPNSYTTPLYVIDGLMTKETAAFLNLTPSKIISIKIIKNSAKLARWRSLGANGIILVRTTNPGETLENLRPDNMFPVRGTSMPYTVADLSWQGRNPQIPDLRPSLQWNANLALDQNGRGVLRFRTSDDATKFRINVQGMTLNGTPFSKQFVFNVEYQPL